MARVYFYNSSFYQIILIILVLLTFFTKNPSYAENLDINILKKIHVQRVKDLDNTFDFISVSSSYISLGIPILILSNGFLKKDSSLLKTGKYCSEVILVSILTSTTLKHLTKRNRPFISYPEIIENVANEEGYSFPSRHTSNAFATATSLSIAFPKWYVIIPSFVWASSVGYSRLHLGAHYPSDVFAGALLGCASGYVTYKVNEWINKKINKD